MAAAATVPTVRESSRLLGVLHRDPCLFILEMLPEEPAGYLVGLGWGALVFLVFGGTCSVCVLIPVQPAPFCWSSV